MSIPFEPNATAEMAETELVNLFRDFHQNPELSGQEYKTTAKIRSILEAAGIEILDLPLKTGLVARIGSNKGKPIALRCDIDALPIHEESGLSYASQTASCMHACGHDFHLTSMIGAARFLKQREDELNKEVLLIFQPAEEVNGGAQQVLATGALESVDRIFGIHCSPLQQVGTLGIKAGAVTAAVDRFEVHLSGKGGHGAMPHQTADPIPVLANLILAAQTIVGRNVNPFSKTVVSFTHVEAGQTWNVIPDTAYLEGTVRSLDPGDRIMIEQRLRELAEHTARAHRLDAVVKWMPGPAATINTGAEAQIATDVALDCGFMLQEPLDSMIGEDFAYYLQTKPGCFIMIGTGLSHPLHNPQFTVDPKAIWPTSQYLAALALWA